MNLELTFDLLPVFGVALVFLSYYVPKFKTWYEELPPEKKQLTNAQILGIAGLGAVVLSALDIVDVYGGDTWQSWVVPPVVDWLIALLANASTYKATNYILDK